MNQRERKKVVYFFVVVGRKPLLWSLFTSKCYFSLTTTHTITVLFLKVCISYSGQIELSFLKTSDAPTSKVLLLLMEPFESEKQNFFHP